jgi:segregation and condensation protein B
MALTPPALLEALLFSAGEPLQKKRLSAMIGVTPELLQKAVDTLRQELSGRGLDLVETETELELRTHADAFEVVKQLRENELSRDLGKAGLETLAIILYRGSATRAEVDWVRGVNSSQTIRSLLIRGLVERTEDVSDKRRARYKPTVDALAHLGSPTREQLPRFEEFTAGLTRAEERATQEAGAEA